MIVKNKVGLMSKLAMFEKSSEGKMALRDISLFRYDHIRWDLLKTGASVTVGYALILALIIMYNLEYLIKNATSLDYKDIGVKTLGIYLVVMVVYLVFTFLYSACTYSKNRRKFVKYRKLLSQMERIYDEEETEEESK